MGAPEPHSAWRIGERPHFPWIFADRRFHTSHILAGITRIPTVLTALTAPVRAAAVRAVQSSGQPRRSAQLTVDHPLRGLGVPSPLHVDLGGGGLYVADVARGQFDSGRRDVLLEAVD